MADGARQVREQFDLAMGPGKAAPRTVDVTDAGMTTTYDLIHDPDSTGAPWTAAALEKAWLDERHDLSFIAAHFSDSAALAADNTTILRSEALENASADLTNTIILGQGCHLGYNLVDPDGLPVITRTDWAQAAARKRVGVLIAGTGYQFGAGRAAGDTGDIVEYGERMYLNIAQQLRAGAQGTAVPVGKAFIEAKRAYLAVVGSYLGGLHEKQLAETTLFGLPMLAVNVPGARLATGAVETVAPDANGDITVAFPASDPSRRLNPHGGFHSGPDGTLGIPAQPILPVDLADATTSQVLRGVGFRGGTYTDVEGFRPTISSPVTEQTSSLTDAYRSPVFAPIPNRLATVNYLGALASGTTYLVVTPSEYRSTSAASDTGTVRTFSSLNLRLFYRAPATSSLTMPPSFVDLRAVPQGDDVLFEAFVVGDQSVPIESVWVTYTDTTSVFPRMWKSLDLAMVAPGHWTATASLASLGAESAESLVFIAQAANAAGLVSFATNGGAYYRISEPVAATPTPKRNTAVTLLAPPAAGAYRSTATFTARLNEVINGSPVALAGKTVRFALGGQRLAALTNANGDATVSFTLLQRPATGYRISAAFDEDDGNLGSSTSAPFQINKAASALALGTPLHVTFGGAWSAVATLSIGGGAPYETQTLFFLATPTSGGGATRIATTLTGTNGKASVPGWDLPAGTYNLRVLFAKPVPLGGGATYDATSPYYHSAEAVGTVTVGAPRVSYNGDTVRKIGESIALKAIVSPPPGNTQVARVRYVVKSAGVTVHSTLPVEAGASGDWSATIAGGLPVGVYAIHASVVDVDYAGDADVPYLSVYDPTGGFVTGGGWINSPAGAFAADPSRTRQSDLRLQRQVQEGLERRHR